MHILHAAALKKVEEMHKAAADMAMDGDLHVSKFHPTDIVPIPDRVFEQELNKKKKPGSKRVATDYVRQVKAEVTAMDQAYARQAKSIVALTLTLTLLVSLVVTLVSRILSLTTCDP